LTPQENKKLADRVVKFLDAEMQPHDLAALLTGVEKINHRLDKLERALLDGRNVSTQIQHSSLDRFSVSEIIADEILSGDKNEKACLFEPGKPCDHCSMCSARGF